MVFSLVPNGGDKLHVRVATVNIINNRTTRCLQLLGWVGWNSTLI